RPSASAAIRPAPPQTTESTATTTNGPTQGDAVRAWSSTPAATQAFSLRRLLTNLVVVLGGIFALTFLVHVANRSLSSSHTLRERPDARGLAPLEVAPWLAVMWIAGVAIAMWWLVSQS